ncbi:unnamed protein product, partial [marine sediment metagenome]
GNEVSMDVAEDQGRLPEGVAQTLRECGGVTLFYMITPEPTGFGAIFRIK